LITQLRTPLLLL